MGKPTEKTLALLRSWGWYYWSVERYNAFSGKKSDLFNIIDFLVITDYSTIGVQSCGTDFAPHVRKIAEEEVEKTVKWLTQPNRKLILIGWRKVLRVKGGKLRIYKPRIAWFYLSEDKRELLYEEKETDHFGTQEFNAK